MHIYMTVILIGPRMLQSASCTGWVLLQLGTATLGCANRAQVGGLHQIWFACMRSLGCRTVKPQAL